MNIRIRARFTRSLFVSLHIFILCISAFCQTEEMKPSSDDLQKQLKEYSASRTTNTWVSVFGYSLVFSGVTTWESSAFVSNPNPSNVLGRVGSNLVIAGASVLIVGAVLDRFNELALEDILRKLLNRY